jgi:hypothetical protein
MPFGASKSRAPPLRRMRYFSALPGNCTDVRMCVKRLCRNGFRAVRPSSAVGNGGLAGFYNTRADRSPGRQTCSRAALLMPSTNKPRRHGTCRPLLYGCVDFRLDSNRIIEGSYYAAAML